MQGLVGGSEDLSFDPQGGGSHGVLREEDRWDLTLGALWWHLWERQTGGKAAIEDQVLVIIDGGRPGKGSRGGKGGWIGKTC